MASVNINSLFGVAGRVALVTGGSSGLGLMIAKGLVVNGAKVYICALKSDNIEAAVQELNDLGAESGGLAIGFPCDLTSKEGIKEISDFIHSKETHLDILISNAGIRRDAPKPCNVLTAPLSELQASLWSSNYTDWTTSFQVNTMAHYFLSVSLLDLLSAAASRVLPSNQKGKETGRGCIVITSSCASMHNATNIDLTSYATTKAGTDHLVALLAAKFARFYVRVNSINPGFVPSAMNPMSGGEGEDIFRGFVEKVPARRVGASEDIAGAVLYLCSQAGSYVDGRSLVIDGGRILFANGQT